MRKDVNFQFGSPDDKVQRDKNPHIHKNIVQNRAGELWKITKIRHKYNKKQ